MQEEEDRRLKVPQGPSTKIVAPLTGNFRTGNKKVGFIPTYPMTIIIEQQWFVL